MRLRAFLCFALPLAFLCSSSCFRFFKKIQKLCCFFKLLPLLTSVFYNQTAVRNAVDHACLLWGTGEPRAFQCPRECQCSFFFFFSTHTCVCSWYSYSSTRGASLVAISSCTAIAVDLYYSTHSTSWAFVDPKIYIIAYRNGRGKRSKVNGKLKTYVYSKRLACRCRCCCCCCCARTLLRNVQCSV